MWNLSGKSLQNLHASRYPYFLIHRKGERVSIFRGRKGKTDRLGRVKLTSSENTDRLGRVKLTGSENTDRLGRVKLIG